MIAGKIEEYLITYDPGDAAYITGLFFGFKTNVTLLCISKLVVNNKLYSSVEFVIQKFFNFFEIRFCGAACKNSKLLTTQVKICVEAFPFIKTPEALLELNPVFTKGHLVSIVKLCSGGIIAE